ncbi:MAG: hypothetical protein M5T61_21325 [Acidimicrobiia bacterium]|nr:hypothetical protein [Acidimicrobiia bacterium]
MDEKQSWFETQVQVVVRALLAVVLVVATSRSSRSALTSPSSSPAWSSGSQVLVGEPSGC